MDYLVKQIKLVFTFLFLSALIIYARLDRETVTEKSFVGKWKSSRMETPIYLYDNGEWEIKTDDDAILQYEVWQYENKKVIWGFKQNDSHILRDVNAVLSATPLEFQVQENDRSITTFKKLDQIK